ncbi:hypothetical protein DFH08DRAFT_850753 [Mycena albidolilacea]|uniref:HIT domain-containing protein n=1 Tax=Mycena albidolilacea TaxID=1033008 RepID=A0AAD7AFQ7_9AGAR|nr:hypothetical protein DFH08DRAFT_850753 [Mycena albidolilacea]
MAFPAKPGCPMCGIVSKAAIHVQPNSPRSPSFPAGSTEPEFLWRDDNFTAYREKANPVSSKGHVIVSFNLHVPSIYTLSSTDLPLLVNIRNLATRLLNNMLDPTSPTPSTSASYRPNPNFRIGFITPPFWDGKIPVTDHLHAHAYIAPADLTGWFRGIAYGPAAWYAIDDLIAEIRESVTNNRIKSGHDNRARAPIDMVPDAGSRSGTANGIETSEPGLASTEADLEAGLTPTAINPRATLSPQNSL